MHKNAKWMASAAALLIVLSGCSKQPGGQVVAVVNNEEITQQDLNTELQGARVPPGFDQKRIMPALLQRVVDRTLVTQLAKNDGLDKTPAYLDQLRAMQEQLLAKQYVDSIAKAATPPNPTTVDAFIANNPTMFSQRKRYTLNQIVFAPPSDPALIQKLEAAHTLNAITAVLTAAQILFGRGVGKLDTAAIPPQIAAKIATVPPGQAFILPDNGRVIASVVQSVEPAPVTADQARPAATNLLRQKALSDAVDKKLTAARASAKISYEPGFAPPPTPLGQ